MTTYRLMDGVSGRPANVNPLVSFSGTFQAGLAFTVTAGGLWFSGYWWWVPTGGDTAAQKFCLYNVFASGPTGSLVPGATVTSGTLTANSFNFVALATPVPIAIGGTYLATTAWTVVHGFPDNQNQFGSGDPFAAGITNGPLMAYGDGTNGGTNGAPYGLPQGQFGTSNTDPTSGMPGSSSNSSNFGIDVQVTDTAPAGYSGTYRLYPNKSDTNAATSPDASVNYVVATEFHLSQACTLNKIWYYSPAGTTQLATSADIWSILGVNSGSVVAGTNSPTWSGAAGSGWVSCSFTGVTLPAGPYKVSVFNDAGTPDGWSAKDASTNYWDTGLGGSGITSGPLSAPGLAAASLAFEYNGSNGGSTPPFSSGTTERGQCTFAQSGSNSYPPLYVDGLAQNYWLDLEVTPVPPAASPAPLVVPQTAVMQAANW